MDREPEDLAPALISRFHLVEARLDALLQAVTELTTERRHVDVGTAARRLGVHPCTVRRAIARGELRADRIGRRVLVTLPEPAP